MCPCRSSPHPLLWSRKLAFTGAPNVQLGAASGDTQQESEEGRAAVSPGPQVLSGSHTRGLGVVMLCLGTPRLSQPTGLS